MDLKFALIGSGRVASHLAPALVRGGLSCFGIWSRSLLRAETLAGRVGTKAFDSLGELIRKGLRDGISFVLLSVSDDAIPGIVKALPSDLAIPVIHTSGSTGLDALEPLKHRGVLYPLQTFSHERQVDLSQAHFFIECNTPETETLLGRMTGALNARDVRHITSEERLRLHIAAVFGCNFVNHIYALASKVLSETSIPFTALEPLLRETLEKALQYDPKSVQTGPAVRRDDITLSKHADFLKKKDEDLAFVYSILTKNIQSLSEEE